ncbi:MULTISPECIES: hypothetical protein [Streptomyces]|uniref:Uncharacterized protein n=1 Tax=Streptomyces virginiae TaxID=1961 RepID=A0ABZ1TME1_STRVG|nr:hypothetical protein [Streptomyces virginiae]WTB26452.1 hypothetical protein OG253_35960 [Streptomyces virginiae]
MDIGLDVGGFVDVLLLPRRSELWPAEGTVGDFEIWWADDRKQIRLKPADPRYLTADFANLAAKIRPGWLYDIGRPVRSSGRSAPDAADTPTPDPEKRMPPSASIAGLPADHAPPPVGSRR